LPFSAASEPTQFDLEKLQARLNRDDYDRVRQSSRMRDSSATRCSRPTAAGLDLQGGCGARKSTLTELAAAYLPACR